jgi:hypothetical protein
MTDDDLAVGLRVRINNPRAFYHGKVGRIVEVGRENLYPGEQKRPEDLRSHAWVSLPAMPEFNTPAGSRAFCLAENLEPMTD